jgi:hypothetical protein
MNNSIIKIMNYNIWASELFIEQRLSNLTGLVYYYNCDVLCFQDLSPFIFNKLIHALGLNYPYIISTPELEKDNGKGLAIFSKHKINKFDSVKLNNSISNNYFLVAKITKGEVEYNISTVQLDDSSNKLKQYDQVLEYMNTIRNLILTGDFIIKEDENHLFNYNTNIWKDSWIEDGEDSNKQFTSDFKTNIFVKKINQERFDRIYYKKNDLELSSFTMIGKNNNPTPSSRYGLVTHFKINDTDNSNAELPIVSNLELS